MNFVNVLPTEGDTSSDIPYEHGVSLAKVIPNAGLLTLEGTGHELPYGDWDLIINAILNHTSVV
jgi:pimeloyl-ACP methyl ester carboxylesterase